MVWHDVRWYDMMGFGVWYRMRCGVDGLAGLSILDRWMATFLCRSGARDDHDALGGAVWECRWMLASATRLFVWCFDLASRASAGNHRAELEPTSRTR